MLLCNKRIIIVIFLTMPLFLSAQTNIDTFTSTFFGFDFWSSDTNFWQEVYTQMEADTFPFGLVGSDAINWQKIEPNPPQNGIHQYNWDALDPFMKATQSAGKSLELGIRPASNWGTEVKADEIENWALGMSPILSDENSDTLNWGMTAKEAWYDFVFNLVERYDGDGDKLDAPWVKEALINTIIIGNEPEAPSHFFDYGGNMKALHEMLEVTYNASKLASPEIIIARGKSNSGRLFDDMPDSFTIAERGGYYLDSLKRDFELGGNCYDVFAINYNDHYTQLPYFVEWLKNEMTKNGFSKPFIVADARTTLCPRDNFYNNDHLLPQVYSSDFMRILENPDHPDYKEIKQIYQKDEVMQSIKKIIMATVTGQKHISLQPVFSNLESSEPMQNRKYMWYYSGFFDPYIYETSGNIATAREPVYWALKQLANTLIGAELKVMELNTGQDNYVFKFSKKGNVFFIAWHENNFAFDNQNGLRARNQQAILNLTDYTTESSVRISHFIEETDKNGLPVHINDSIVDKNNIHINEMPIIILPKKTTLIKSNSNKKNEILLFPNPFQSTLNINSNIEGKKEIKLFDVTGTCIKTITTYNKEISISVNGVSKGIYILTFSSKKLSLSKQLVKIE